MKTQEEYAFEIDEIVRRDVESCQSDWFIIDKEIFMQPENKNKAFILGTRKTGCDMIVLGGTNCSGSNMDWLFGCLGNENFYVCQPVSFYKSQQEIQKVNPLYAFKVATAYFREQGKVPVFEDSNCRLAWIRIKGNIIETSKQIKIGIAEARKLWRAVSAMHRGAEFRHGLVEDITGHQWSLNRYENDLLTAGCHRIAYNEMERIAKQLGWV